MTEDLSHRLRDMTQAVENVLVASHAPMHDLLKYHQTKGTKVPPFETNSGELTQDEKRESAMVAALKHYGVGPIFSLWVVCQALEQLRTVWTGKETKEWIASPPVPDAPIATPTSP